MDIVAPVERLTLTCAWLLEALASATDRDQFDFLVLGAPPAYLTVMRAIDADGLIAGATPEAPVTVGGGTGLDTPAASASGDGQRPIRDAVDLPAADTPLVSRARYADQLRADRLITARTYAQKKATDE